MTEGSLAVAVLHVELCGSITYPSTKNDLWGEAHYTYVDCPLQNLSFLIPYKYKKYKS